MLTNALSAKWALETVYTFAFKEHGYNCKLSLGKADAYNMSNNILYTTKIKLPYLVICLWPLMQKSVRGK